MSQAKIRFKKVDEDMVYKPKQRIDTYYQICQFKNQFTKKYGTRKVVFNELGEILKVYEKEYSTKKLESFMKHHRKNKYKIFPTNDINIVDLPNGADIICSCSELINNTHVEYDNANANLF